MDKKWTLMCLAEAQSNIETVIANIESDDENALTDFYGNITNAYWNLNYAWNALGHDNVSTEMLTAEFLHEIGKFPESIDDIPSAVPRSPRPENPGV